MQVASKLGLSTSNLPGAAALARIKRRSTVKPPSPNGAKQGREPGDKGSLEEALSMASPRAILESLSSASQEPRDEILGGELLVQVVDAQVRAPYLPPCQIACCVAPGQAGLQARCYLAPAAAL